MTGDATLLRVVLDTNVWISGIFFDRGLPADVLTLWRDVRFEVVITNVTLGELAHKLFQKATEFGAEPSLARDWLDYIELYAARVTASGKVSGVCRDPTDDKFLDAAISGRASVLVTGDKDLLDIGEYQSIRILSPRDFRETLT
jgi:putative PIN family toxin of toxin-antitoxin system